MKKQTIGNVEKTLAIPPALVACLMSGADYAKKVHKVARMAAKVEKLRKQVAKKARACSAS
jgi:hypothetical protein